MIQKQIILTLDLVCIEFFTMRANGFLFAQEEFTQCTEMNFYIEMR